MIPKWTMQSPVFGELTPEEKVSWFDLKRNKVTAHVDTLYYSVSVYGDHPDSISDNMQELLDALRAAKSRKNACFEAYEELFGLEVQAGRFAQFYEYKLSLNENFDIFIASYIPTDHTPRIVVQLRTRMLVLDGTFQAVCKSFAYVERILDYYGLEVDKVYENRIDYAFHTNLIQNPYRFFSDKLLLKKLKSKLRLYHKVGNIGASGIDIDYVSFGNRKSNDVFVRIYNKSREVVEKNYKSFFFDKWLADGLINRYDFYVYSKAYAYSSFVTGMLVGRIDWYLEFGKDEEKKKELAKVKESCFVKSDNTDFLRKKVDVILPPATLIVNVEYQTKRKFYCSLDGYLGVSSFLQDLDSGLCNLRIDLPLKRLHTILACRKEICDYLTSTSLSFVDKKGTKEEQLSKWWSIIHSCKIEDYNKMELALWRSHSRQTDIEKHKRKFCSTVASVSLLKNQDIFEDSPRSSFIEDISDVLCILNDNDFYGFAPNPENGEALEIEPEFYSAIQRKKKRQLRGVIEKNKN